MREVTLAPFFISKYEVTLSQWSKLPRSIAKPESVREQLGKQSVTLRNPVDNVSWSECMEWLPRYELTLPTEAAWCSRRAVVVLLCLGGIPGGNPERGM